MRIVDFREDPRPRVVSFGRLCARLAEVPGIARIRYTTSHPNDMDADLIDGETAGFLVEPIQGEGGVRTASQEFLQGLRQLADEHDLMLVLDEVQCGVGRCGTFYAHEHYGIDPDILATAKGIGGDKLLGGPQAGLLVGRKKAVDALRRGVFVPGTSAIAFFAVPMGDMAGFVAMVFLGVINRKRLDYHKRYMLLGTAAIALAAGFWMKRQRKYALGFGVVLLLIGLVTRVVPADARDGSPSLVAMVAVAQALAGALAPVPARADLATGGPTAAIICGAPSLG